ncbi:HAMP domain-containing histidine kinase [Cohnella sp. NL03-T5]|uniref:histidine kinase n=1 Tax=Cohnella silvisoli TaxID=2873699 RepID=A0ABV1KXA0_9BACL|nr:HAMP domain-containing histidine kinase [Cohnella silvisoli]
MIFTGVGSFSEVVMEPDLRSFFFFILQACSPYGFVMFAISYSEAVTRRTKNVLAYVLLLPLFVTLLISPLKPEIQIDFILMLLWTAPYYLGGCFLLVSSYLRERNRVKRKYRLLTACFFVPPIIAIVVFNHITRAVKQDFDGYFNLSIVVWCGFAFFIIAAIRFGVLGVRIRFEKQLHDQKIKGIASGAAMFNHAVKNRITNIDMLTGRVRELVKSERNEQIDEDIKRIMAETKQVMHMVKRIQKQIEDVELVEGTANLIDLMTHALHANRYPLESKSVSISTDYSVNCNMMCDKLHLQEVFNNLISNAIDAVEGEGGTLAIRIYEAKSGIRIDFTDNGTGMVKKAEEQIFDPFYSTKQREENFGLGLSYCYLIMQKHGGSIKVSSSQGAGTTFTLHLPKYRRIRTSNKGG